MTDLVKKEQGELTFTREHIDLIKSQIAPGLSDNELKLFLHVCKTTRLDPLMRQIYVVKRRVRGQDKMTFQVSIDGSRLVADRSGCYAGSDDSMFTYASSDENQGTPLTATVTVWKLVHGIRCAFTATARWSQYFPGEELGFMWRKMPHVMLAKCAEALALRKAFPAELSNLYVKEEMDQAAVDADEIVLPRRNSPVNEKDATAYTQEVSLVTSPSSLPNEEPPPPTDADYIPEEESVQSNPIPAPFIPERISKKQIAYVHVLKKSAFPADDPVLTDELLKDHLAVTYRVKSLGDLTKRQAIELVNYMLSRK